MRALTLLLGIFLTATVMAQATVGGPQDQNRLSELEARIQTLEAQVAELEARLSLALGPGELPYVIEEVALDTSNAYLDPVTLLNIGLLNLTGSGADLLVTFPGNNPVELPNIKQGQTWCFAANERRYKLFVTRLLNSSYEHEDRAHIVILEDTKGECT